ncbi:hypothetical protein LX36DRAFT_589788 [Colletotrichum falcatum]|nr:hypothetical protein LX36DRAFT_589788 [Colletotrichum falcatum]
MDLLGVSATAVVRRVGINHTPEPRAGKVSSIIVAMISACLLTSLFVVRWLSVRDWRILPWTMWRE